MLLAFYDYAISPPSFDFLTFAVCAEAYKLECGYDDMSICFIPGPNKGFKKKTIKPISIEEHKYRHSHLVLPLAHMMGAKIWEPGYRIKETPGEHVYPPTYRTDHIIPGYHAGMAFKVFPHLLKKYAPWPVPSEKAMEMVERDFPRKPFVITLRECYTPERNSDLMNWRLLADYARDKGESVVVVRDTDKPFEPFHSHKIAPLASMDVDYRLALYKYAVMNFGINNGTSALYMYSDMPYRMFKMTTETYYPTSTKFMTSNGMAPGSQPPWATENQRFVWKDDFLPALKYEFDDWKQNASRKRRNNAGRGIVENREAERSRASA